MEKNKIEVPAQLDEENSAKLLNLIVGVMKQRGIAGAEKLPDIPLSSSGVNTNNNGGTD